MKKALLYSILALSLTAFAQRKQTMIQMQNPETITMHNIPSSMPRGKWNTQAIHPKINSVSENNHLKSMETSMIQIFDSIYYWKWDTISISWKIDSKDIHKVADANGNFSDFTEQTWNGSTWENSFKYQGTFDANNNYTSETYQNWNGSAWEIIGKYIYTYTYDIHNNITSETEQKWNGSAWEIIGKYTYIYTYDINNNMTSEIVQRWNGSSWDNSRQYFYTYDINNNQLSQIEQDLSGNTWINSSQRSFTYDAKNNLTNELFQNWNGSEWVNSRQYIYSYNAKNLQTGELDQNWMNNSWLSSYQFLSTYDANNFMQSETNKPLLGEQKQGDLGDSTYYYYHTVVTGLSRPMETGVTIYPNPSRGKVTLNSNSPINAVEIYNISGRRVYSNYNFKQQPSGEIDLSGYAKGIYIMRVHNGAMVYNRKVVVQ